MSEQTWENMLVLALLANAFIGLAYRIYRRTQGGPIADVWGQTVLAVLLGGLVLALVLGAGWPRWAALVYALVFALLVMPVWVLGVLMPLRPRAVDYTFMIVYWVLLLMIGVAAVLA